MKQNVSVVIPTKNGGSDLVRLVERLLSQRIDWKPDILLIDSGSTDGSLEEIRQEGVRIAPVAPWDFNHGRTRNEGIRRTSGEYIFLFTQDALPIGDDFMATMLRTMIDEQAAGVYANQTPRAEASPLVERNVRQWMNVSNEKRVSHWPSLSDFHQLDPMQQYYACVFDNVASLIRREVWQLIPFSPVAFGEDIDWSYRAIQNGYKIVFEPNAVVAHSHERPAHYEYKRTYVDHYHLHELFGLRTVPTRYHMLRSFLITLWKDWAYLATCRHSFWNKAKWALKCPAYSWAAALGQYRGAKAAASGISPATTKDV